MNFERQLIAFILVMCVSSIAIQGVSQRPHSPEAAVPTGGAIVSGAGIEIYRRGVPPTLKDPIQVIFTGDLMLGRESAEVGDPFARVAQTISGADLAVGNLESLLMIHPAEAPSTEQSIRNGYDLSAPPASIMKLQRAGFDLIGLANNHSWDLGRTGLLWTQNHLQTAGILPIGVHPNQIVYRKIKGIVLAFLAYNAVPVPGMPSAIWDRELALERIAEAKRRDAFVVVLIHWGEEYSRRTIWSQRDAAKALVGAGADLVIGSHPHVIQPTEMIARPGAPPALIAYSLGNFVFDQEWDEVRHSAALRVSIDSDGLAAVKVLPVTAGRLPHWTHVIGSDVVTESTQNPDLIAATCATANFLTPPGERQYFFCRSEGCQQTMQVDSGPDRYETHRRSVISADLAGDGIPEQIRLEGGRLSIVENGELAWRSPENWHIYDYDAGDPNDDGREEVVVVFDKISNPGSGSARLQSHPFLIGYRGGEYREVWGGSAVSEPIREVALGDLNGDRQQELVVIEDRCSGINLPEMLCQDRCESQSVAVWGWNGWGFSRLWRSEIGKLHSLEILTNADGDNYFTVVRSW